jgi:hypothetical protein
MYANPSNLPQNLPYAPAYFQPPTRGETGSNAAGALNLVNGIVGIILSLIIAFTGGFAAVTTLCICGFVVFLGSVFSLGGAYMCYERNSFNVALILTILGMILPGITIICFILGLIALILLVTNRSDFFDQALPQYDYYPIMVMPYPMAYQQPQMVVTPQPSHPIQTEPAGFHTCNVCGKLKPIGLSKCPECGAQNQDLTLTPKPEPKLDAVDEFR